MHPLALVQERKPRKDREIKKGHHSTSSSLSFHHGSSSHQFDDDEEIQEEDGLPFSWKCASLLAPNCQFKEDSISALDSGVTYIAPETRSEASSSNS
ncbi:hypothetical protein Tco_1010221 [Tanacetum coccineum]